MFFDLGVLSGVITLAMYPTRYCELGSFFLMLRPDIIQFGRGTSDFVRGMGVRGLN